MLLAALAGAYGGYRAATRLGPAVAGSARPADAAGGAAEPVARAADLAVAATNAALMEAELTQLRDDNAVLAGENDKLKGHLNNLLNWVLANFRGRYPVPEGMMGRMNVPALGEDFLVHPELADFLKISPEEQQWINEAFLSARAMLQEAEGRVMTASLPTPDTAVVEIPPLEAEGEAVREMLVNTFEQALGAARSQRLQQVAAGDLERRFNDFGRARRTLRFELVYGDGSGTPMLKIRDEKVRADEDGRRRIEATEFESQDVPDEYRFYLSRIPGTEKES